MLSKQDDDKKSHLNTLDGQTLRYIASILDMAQRNCNIDDWLSISGMRVWTIVDDILLNVQGDNPINPQIQNIADVADKIDAIVNNALNGDVANLFASMEKLSPTHKLIPVEVFCVNYNKCGCSTEVEIPENSKDVHYAILKQLENTYWSDITTHSDKKIFICPTCASDGISEKNKKKCGLTVG